MKKFFLVSLLFALVFCICGNALANTPDYDEFKANELTPFDKEWPSVETGWIYNLFDPDYKLTRTDGPTEKDGFKVLKYALAVKGLEITVYADPESNKILKAFVSLNWKGLSNDEQKKAGGMMLDVYSCLASVIGYEESEGHSISNAWKQIDLTSLTLNHYRQYVDDGMVFYGWFSTNYQLDAGLFREKADTSDTTANADLSASNNETPVTEILFRGLPWGINLPEAEEKLGWSIWGMAGEYMKTYSIDDIVLGDYEGIRFEYSDINIIGNVNTKDISVAGYPTSDVVLYFAYVPKGGIVTHEEADSALYGARYEFEPKNHEAMFKDLKEKLTSQYGEPTKTSNRSDYMGNKYNYVFWLGANDTEVVLCDMEATKDSSIYKDEVKICYIWLKGDEMLQTACDAEKQAAENAESNNYGTDNTDGL